MGNFILMIYYYALSIKMLKFFAFFFFKAYRFCKIICIFIEIHLLFFLQIIVFFLLAEN